LILGGGRETKESEIDLAVGIVLTKKVGDKVEKGDVIAYIHANDPEKLENAKERFLNAYTFSEEKPAESKMIKYIIS
jgi:pyrimidine-nucleoside phosphorylase